MTVDAALIDWDDRKVEADTSKDHMGSDVRAKVSPVIGIA